MAVTKYGHIAMCSDIRRDLGRTLQIIDCRVFLRFQHCSIGILEPDLDRGDNAIDLVRIGARNAIKAVEGFFLSHRENPRGFSATIRSPAQFNKNLSLNWMYQSDRW